MSKLTNRMLKDTPLVVLLDGDNRVIYKTDARTVQVNPMDVICPVPLGVNLDDVERVEVYRSLGSPHLVLASPVAQILDEGGQVYRKVKFKGLGG